MNLSEAQADRHQREALADQAAIAAVTDALCDAVKLADAPNFRQVTPGAKKKLSGLISHYRKMAKPFTACVRDNTKRFGPERAKKVCAVLTDLEKGTTKWRNGGKKKASLSLAEPIVDIPEVDSELFDLLDAIGRTDYKAILGLEVK